MSVAFFCQFCLFTGPRSLSEQLLPPGSIPGFDDICPRCGGDDLDIFLPGVAEVGGDDYGAGVEE